MLYWTKRVSVPFLVSVLATFCLMNFMRSLVRVGSSHVEQKYPRLAIEYVRAKKPVTLETKKRTLPRRETTTPVQTWQPTVAMNSSAPSAAALPVSIPSSHSAGASLSLAGGPMLGAGGADSDAVPLVRVNPMYPPKALARQVEGWVLLEFTVTAHGTTKDILILDSDPKGYFEKAAFAAVQKYRYKPRIVDGQATEREGVQVVLSFDVKS